MTHFFGIFLDRNVPADRGLELCSRMARAFDPNTYVQHDTRSIGRLGIGFAVPRRLAGRVGSSNIVARENGLTVFGDVTLYNNETIRAGLPPSGSLYNLPLLHHFVRNHGNTGILNGDFALGIYDEDKQQLILMRDQIGSRILYYARRPEGLLFSTRIHAFFDVGFDRSDLDPMALASYLVMRNPGAGRTYYPTISELEPAHRLVVQPDLSITKRRYWSLEPSRTLGFSKSEDWVEHIGEVFVKAVTSRMRDAERPAIKLSGGLDSSSVAGVMCAKHEDREILAFSHVPSFAHPAPDDDDAPYLKAVEGKWDNLSLRRIRSDRFNVLSGPGHWQRTAASPCIDPFFFAEDALAKTMLDHNVDIVLSGYAGDHCFSAYSHPVLLEQISTLHWHDALTEYRRLRAQTQSSIFQIIIGRIVARLLPANLKNARKALLGRPWHRDFAISHDYLTNRDFTDHLKSNGFHALMHSPLSMQSQHRQNISAEMSHFIAFEDCFHGDSGYRNRRPLLDIDLLQSVISAPVKLMVNDRYDRALIRQVARPFLPGLVGERLGKSAFVPDYFARLGSSADVIRQRLSEFRDLDIWQQIIDIQKVNNITGRVGIGDTMVDAHFVQVLQLILMPYYAGCFLQNRAV